MLVDAFLYFNEKELVELRIKYLNDLVDHFVVVEADVTHQGKKKEWFFQKILENNHYIDLRMKDQIIVKERNNIL